MYATFQSTSLSRGKTYWQAGYSRAEGFQSTSLSRGKTHKGSPTGDWYTAFNPLPSHEGRQAGGSGGKSQRLSIHFPLTREDAMNAGYATDGVLSIHFPLTREDILRAWYPERILIFQSTSLSRGKTILQNSFEER